MTAPMGRRQPISCESLLALAGLTDDLLGIVPDDGDEHNPDDLDLVESPRLEMSKEMIDYENTRRNNTPPRARVTMEGHDDELDSDEEDDYAMRSVDVAMSRAADAPREAGRLRLGLIHEDQPIQKTIQKTIQERSIEEDLLNFGEDFDLEEDEVGMPYRSQADVPSYQDIYEDRSLSSCAPRPKSAMVVRPSQKVNKPNGKGGRGKRAPDSRAPPPPREGSARSRQGAGRSMKHRDLVAEALAKDPKKLSRGMHENFVY